MSRCIVVMTTGRSGSSAVAGMLHHLGIHMTSREHTAGFNNANHPGGHWEDLRWHRLGLEIIASQDNGPYTVDAVDLKKYRTLSEERDRYDVWGIKTPTFSHLFKWLHWGGVFPIDTRLIAVHRHIFPTVKSLRQKEQKGRLSWSEAMRIQGWRIRAMLDQLEYAYDFPLPVLHISFEELLKNPQLHVIKIAEFCGISQNNGNELRAAAFVDPQYVRHR